MKNTGITAESCAIISHLSGVCENNYVFVMDRTRSRRHTENPALALQRFSLEDGYITCTGNTALVLAVREQEGRVVDVVVARRKQDDIHQRWIQQQNG